MKRRMGDLAATMAVDGATDQFLSSFLPPSRQKDTEAEALKKRLEAIPTSSSDDIGKLVTCHDFAEAIRREWSEMERRALRVGRILNRAKAAIEHGEFMKLVTEMTPFSQGVANMLMRAAAAIDDGVVDPSRLPNDYRLIDAVASMSPEQRAAADAAGLIRPDVKRAEIMAFKRKDAPGDTVRRTLKLARELSDALSVVAPTNLSTSQRGVLLELKRKIDAALGSA